MPGPFIVRAEVTAENTSIRVSWEWSCQGVPMYINSVRVHYQPEGGSLMIQTVENTAATSATLPNLQCNTMYTIWVYSEVGQMNKTSASRMVSLPARGICTCYVNFHTVYCTVVYNTVSPPAPPTPTDVTAEVIIASSVRVAWQWTSSGSAPNCFNTTTVTYCPEGGGKSSLQLSDPAATESTLTDLQCNTTYTITVVATAGEHRRKSVARTVYLPLQGIYLSMHVHLCKLVLWKWVTFESQIIPVPVRVRAEATADNTSVRVSWKWSCRGVPMDINHIRVHYQPEGGSLMMYTVDNTTATSATLSNLLCNTEYTIWVYVESGSHMTSNMSAPSMVSLAARGTYIICM